jgi:hypothetical protein
LPQYMIALRRHYINWTTGLNNFQWKRKQQIS